MVDGERPTLRFGRSSENEIAVGDEFASRAHGRIEHRDGGFHLTDSSRNGTLVTLGNRTVYVHEETAPLEDQGTIRLGHIEGTALAFVVEIESADGQSWAAGLPAAAEPTGVRYVFRTEGDYWTLAYGEGLLRLKDTKGLHVIAHLLQHPRTEFHVLDLATLGPDAGASDERTTTWRGGPGRRPQGSPGPVLDAQAKAAYRRRLEELRAELDEAETNHDLGRAGQAREEMEAITAQLVQAVGLGGRDREAGADAERARVMITTRVKSSLDKIRRGHPALGHHLATCLKTGRFCSYQPDPTRPVEWEL